MSITIPNGRLCNQIIRNLVVSQLAKKHDLYVQYSSYDEINNQLGIKLYIGKNKYEDSFKLNDENFFILLELSNVPFNLYSHENYFQTKEISNYLYEYLRTSEVKNSIINHNKFSHRFNKNNDLFIHLRTTDAKQWIPSLEYYLNTIKKINFDKLFIASDNFMDDYIKKIQEQYPKSELVKLSAIETIKFGSTCKNIILSHGSFSAMIGWLAYDSIIYYPDYSKASAKWFGDMFDIPGWQRIE